MAQLILPIFARASTVSVLEQALIDGALKDIDRICWCYIIDTGYLVYVDPEKQIHTIVGDNKISVQRVGQLPDVNEGDTEVLYIVNDVVYTFDGIQYKPTFYEVKIELDTLKTQVQGIDNRLEIAEENISSISETLTNLGVTVNAVQAELSNKANANDVYTKVQTDTLLEQKADSDDVYGRDYIDTVLSNKADADEVYSKNEMDTALNGKADKSNTYTKDEVDALTHVDVPGQEPVTITEYVNQSTEGAIQNAHDYTDQQLAIHFI